MTDLLDTVPLELPARDLLTMSEAELMSISDELDDFLADLSEAQQDALIYEWDFWKRPSQRTPAGMGLAYRVWNLRAGRGFGKTMVGAQETRKACERSRYIGLIGRTAADVRDVMVEGESGIMRAFPPHQRPHYEPSKRRITFWTGSTATAYSAEEPESLRGPQHEWLWGDEPASWALGKEVISNAFLGLRLGKTPWMLLTGTPKPVAWLTELGEEATTVLTTGSTYENAGNLAAMFLTDIIGRYEGTRLGRQEIYAEVLDDVEGALWAMAVLNRNRIVPMELPDGTLSPGWNPKRPWASLNRWLKQNNRLLLLPDRPWHTVVAVDPPGSTAECGIVVGTAPIDAEAGRDHAAILADHSLRGAPEVWGAAVVNAYRTHRAEYVVVEANQGGDMVRSTIHAVDPNVPVRKIHAQESKKSRAEPVSALDARGMIHHVGSLGMLEAQMTTWVPGEGNSPDRVDARVHLVRDLLPSRRLVASRLESPKSSPI